MFSKLVESLSESFFESDLVGTRIILGASEFLWGAMLLWPGHVFERPTYHHMSLFAPEWVWAVIFLLSAWGQLWIVTSKRFESAFARNFAFWNATLWMAVIISMLFSVYPPPAAISGEISLALAATWIWLRPFVIIAGIRKSSGFVPL